MLEKIMQTIDRTLSIEDICREAATLLDEISGFPVSTTLSSYARHSVPDPDKVLLALPRTTEIIDHGKYLAPYRPEHLNQIRDFFFENGFAGYAGVSVGAFGSRTRIAIDPVTIVFYIDAHKLEHFESLQESEEFKWLIKNVLLASNPIHAFDQLMKNWKNKGPDNNDGMRQLVALRQFAGHPRYGAPSNRPFNTVEGMISALSIIERSSQVATAPAFATQLLDNLGRLVPALALPILEARGPKYLRAPAADPGPQVTS